MQPTPLRFDPYRRPLLFAVVVAALAACKPAGLPATERFADDYARAHPDRVGDVRTFGRPIHYVTGGTKGSPKVVFVHGSPGSWKSFSRFLDDPALASRAFLIAPDRPGYGGSGAGTPEPSLAMQAGELSALLNLDDSTQPAILVGHSYGGPVVIKMASGGDARVRGVVVIAGSVDPALEKKKWIQYLADLKIVRWVLPRDLDVCNSEIEALKGELTVLRPDWARVRAAVTVIQGTNDDLVPPANADYLATMIPDPRPRIQRVAGLDHFIPWERPDLIRAAVLEELGELKPEPALPWKAESISAKRL